MVLTTPRRRSLGEARIAFDALSIEGGLLGADWLGKVAQLRADAQEPSDYRVPKGLHIRDEIARSWRIAQACFREMEAGRASGGNARALAERFLEAFLRDALCFASVTRVEPRTIGERVYPVRFFALGDRVPSSWPQWERAWILRCPSSATTGAGGAPSGSCRST